MICKREISDCFGTKIATAVAVINVVVFRVVPSCHIGWHGDQMVHVLAQLLPPASGGTAWRSIRVETMTKERCAAMGNLKRECTSSALPAGKFGFTATPQALTLRKNPGPAAHHQQEPQQEGKEGNRLLRRRWRQDWEHRHHRVHSGRVHRRVRKDRAHSNHSHHTTLQS